MKIKILYTVSAALLFISCRHIEKNKEEQDLSKMNSKIGYDLKLKTDNSLISLYLKHNNDSINFKHKRDSLYSLVENELSIKNNPTIDTTWANPLIRVLKTVKLNNDEVIEANLKLWQNSFGSQYRELRLKRGTYTILENNICKQQYIQLLTINYNIRKNISKQIEWVDDNS